MKRIALAMVLAAAGCSEEEHARALYPQVWELYAVHTDGSITCDGPVDQGWTPAGGPFTAGFCEFACVSYGTQNYRRARVDFTRASAAAPWDEALGAVEPGACQ